MPLVARIALTNHGSDTPRDLVVDIALPALEFGAGRGVTLRMVQGFYDKGGSRTNRAGADAVVADVVTRLRASDAAKRTYGIVTFSQAQQQLILNLLDQARTAHPENRALLHGRDCRARDRQEPGEHPGRRA